MNIKRILIGTLPLLMLASCSSDEPIDNGYQEGNGTPTYARISLQMTKTRSNTGDYNDPTNSDDGYEIGKDRENLIKNIILVIAENTGTDDAPVYKPLAVSSDASGLASSENSDIYSDTNFTILFKDDAIRDHKGETIYLFAFCNSALTEGDFTGVTDLAQLAGKVTDKDNDAIWTDNSFLMVNALNKGVPQKELPAGLSDDNNYNSPEKALDLGTIYVSRVVSRFDFKVSSNNAADTPNLYDIKDVNSDTGEVTAQVKLLAMAPFNIAKDFYYLPRVSADGTNTGWSVCGYETTSNWVVTPNFDKKTNTNVSTLLGNYFYNNTDPKSEDATLGDFNYGNEKYFNYTLLDNFAGIEDDNDENWGDTWGGNKSGFKIWRYVSENTLPTVASQKKGLTTGVVFKAEIVNPKEGSTLANAMTKGDIIYSYNGTIYGNANDLRDVVAKLPEGSEMREDFLTAFPGALETTETIVDSETKTDYVTDDAQTLFTTNKRADGSAIYKIFRPTTVDGTNHYYVYYTYYNRHNDNGNPTDMGSMEFATVRNNIYKLYVNSISEFGHTGDPDDDPDPDDPDDPDEEKKTYFKVSCHVVPWMVRINQIDF